MNAPPITASSLLTIAMVLGLAASDLQAQKPPVQDKPKLVLWTLDVRGLIALPPAKEPAKAKKKKKKKANPLPILSPVFPPKDKSKGLEAELLSIESLAEVLKAFAKPNFTDKESIDWVQGGYLLIKATPEKQAWATDFLGLNENQRDQQIQVRTRFLRISEAVFAKHVEPLIAKGKQSNIKSEPKPKPQSATGRTGPLVNAMNEAPVVLPRFALLESAQAHAKLVAALDQAPNTEKIAAPKILCAPLTRGRLLLGKRRAYVRDFEVEIAKAAFIANPVVDTVVDGLEFDATAVHLSKSKVGLGFRFALSDLKLPMREVTTTLAGSTAPITIQLPELTRVSLSSHVELGPNQTAVFAAKTKNKQYTVLLLRAAAVKKPK